MNEGKLKAHDVYLVKKEVAKLLATERGIPYAEAFEQVPDELITHYDHKAIFDSILSAKPKKAKKQK